MKNEIFNVNYIIKKKNNVFKINFQDKHED